VRFSGRDELLVPPDGAFMLDINKKGALAPMGAEFHSDLTACRNDLDAARTQLLAILDRLSGADLERARRGGWTVQRVLEHVIWSELLYAKLVLHLRSQPGAEGDLPECKPDSLADARARLAASREALLTALDGVDEETFYRIGSIGHEEYSVISIIENTVSHDREHTGQIEAILAG
jgi:uncharacterized damage-inducible protein DinB